MTKFTIFAQDAFHIRTAEKRTDNAFRLYKDIRQLSNAHEQSIGTPTEMESVLP